jgi:hypothetical protein
VGCRRDQKLEGARNTKLWTGSGHSMRNTLSCVVVYIDLDVVCFGGDLCPSLYSLDGQCYVEVLT